MLVVRTLFYSLFLVFLLSGNVRADITVTFGYSEAPHLLPGNPLRTAMEQAATEWGRWFKNEATLDIRIVTVDEPESNQSGSSSSAFDFIPLNHVGWWSSVPVVKILEGIDRNGNEFDGTLTINVGAAWSTSDPIVSPDLDFISFIMHELTHFLGIARTISFNGEDLIGQVGVPGVWRPFTEFISDASGQRLLNTTTFQLNLQRWEQFRVAGVDPETDGLYFNGPNAIAANHFEPIRLYTPTTYNSSSIGHIIDEQTGMLSGVFLTSPLRAPGPGLRALSAIERGILMDLGFSLNPIEHRIEGISIVNGQVRLKFNPVLGRQFCLESRFTLDSNNPGANLVWARVGSVILDENYETTTPLSAGASGVYRSSYR